MLRTEHAKSVERIAVNGKQVEEVEEFAYLVKTLGTGCGRHGMHFRD